MRNIRLSTDHCVSMFQHATHTIVVDTAWPWASEAYGLCRLCAYFCAHKLIRSKIIRPYRSADRCFKHATKSIVALDTAWPWANDTYGLCCLRAYFCAHKLNTRKIIRCYSPNRDSYGVLAANKNELAARAFVPKGCRCWCWCCGPGCWCCELAERAFKTGGGAGRVLVPLPVLSAGKVHRCWCQLIVRAVEVP